MGMGTGRSETKSLTKVALHVCSECQSELVQPVAWEQTAKPSEWRLWRRCPECEWYGDGVHTESEVDDFDEQLDFGTRELADELRALEQSNMQEAVTGFVAALHEDLILPEDF
jgi:DNA replicative helicase MCM subunit Mcm2 (Cdc46/Mcm family)